MCGSNDSKQSNHNIDCHEYIFLQITSLALYQWRQFAWHQINHFVRHHPSSYNMLRLEIMLEHASAETPNDQMKTTQFTLSGFYFPDTHFAQFGSVLETFFCFSYCFFRVGGSSIGRTFNTHFAYALCLLHLFVFEPRVSSHSFILCFIHFQPAWMMNI